MSDMMENKCESVYASCTCMHPAGHERFGPHECDCGGAWDDEKRVIRFPVTGGPIDLVVAGMAHPQAEWVWTSDGWERS